MSLLSTLQGRRTRRFRSALILFFVGTSGLAAATPGDADAGIPELFARRETRDYAHSRRPLGILSTDFAKLLVDDTTAVLTSPLRWERREWLAAGALTSLVGLSGVFDAKIKEESQENLTPRLHAFTKNAQRFGAEGSWLVLGAFQAYGILAEDTKAKAVAMDGLSASFVASGVVAPLLKLTVGRMRPNASDHAFDIKPFSGNYSFPSGHTTQAFALAAVISSHYDQWWVQGLSFGLAGVVGYSRIEQNSHYASDVRSSEPWWAGPS